LYAKAPIGSLGRNTEEFPGADANVATGFQIFALPNCLSKMRNDPGLIPES
jgi:hypothetical protein